MMIKKDKVVSISRIMGTALVVWIIGFACADVFFLYTERQCRNEEELYVKCMVEDLFKESNENKSLAEREKNDQESIMLERLLTTILPPSSTNVIVLNSQWFTFEVGGNKFLGSAFIEVNEHGGGRCEIQSITHIKD